MRKLQLLVVLLCLSFAICDQIPGCSGSFNNQTIVTKEPELTAQVPNGKKFVQPYDGRLFYTLVVNGSAYDMGLAQGQLMKDELNVLIPILFDWFESFVATNISVINKLPLSMKKWIAKQTVWGAQGLLNLNWLITKPYTPQRFQDEMQGLADGTGIPVQIFRQINLVGEMLKASCSILGAYGKATKSGKTVHLRALDWEEHAPMNKWPTVVVYHPTEEGSVPFANIAWPGYIGTLTGYNSMKVGVGERLWGLPWKEETRFGKPWQFVLRDGLQFSKTQAQYIESLQNATRTCSIYLGVGGENYFNILKYTAKYVNVYNWSDWLQDQYHPTLEDVLWKAYRDNNMCFANLVQMNYGNITAETVIRQIAPLGQTGDSQVIVMDYATDTIYCMYPNPKTYNPGYNAPAVKIDLSKFFSATVLN